MIVACEFQPFCTDPLAVYREPYFMRRSLKQQTLSQSTFIKIQI